MAITGGIPIENAYKGIELDPPAASQPSKIAQLAKTIFECLRNAFRSLINGVQGLFKKTTEPTGSFSSNSTRVIDAYSSLTLEISEIQVEWGKFSVISNDETIEWKTKRKDVVILPNEIGEGVVIDAWDWNSTNPKVNHNSGIHIAHIVQLVLNKLRTPPNVIIVSTGFGHGHPKGNRLNENQQGVLKVNATLKQYVETATNGKTVVHILNSTYAAEKYNELIKKGERVALLYHATC